MDIAERIFKRKNYIAGRLEEYGFVKEGQGFSLGVPIADGQFLLSVRVSRGGVTSDVIELSVNEPYTLYHVEGAAGAFVGGVRQEAEKVLSDIAEKCFQTEIFKGEQTKAAIDYAMRKYGSAAEYLWEKFPDNAVLRRADNGKWYAAILTVKREKLGLDGEGVAEVIDLREEPSEIDSLVDGRRYFSGYHMNKRHWYTICLDGGVPDGELFGRIDKSYLLAKKT